MQSLGFLTRSELCDPELVSRRTLRLLKVARVSTWAAVASEELCAANRANPAKAGKLAEEIGTGSREWEKYASGERIPHQSVVDRANQRLPRARGVWTHDVWSALDPHCSEDAMAHLLDHYRHVVDPHSLIRSLSERGFRRNINLANPLDSLTLSILTTRELLACPKEHEKTFLWARIVVQELIYLALHEEFGLSYINLWNGLGSSLLKWVRSGAHQIVVAAEKTCLEILITSLRDRLTEIRRLASGELTGPIRPYFSDASISDLVSSYVCLAVAEDGECAERLQALLEMSHPAGDPPRDYSRIGSMPLLLDIDN